MQDILAERDEFCDLLPKNTKLFFPAGNQAHFVIEQPPSKRTIGYTSFGGGKFNTARYKLNVPYIQFVFRITKNSKQYSIYSVKQVASNGPFSLTTQLYQSPFPNVRSDGGICLGYRPKPSSNCRLLIDKTCNRFWQSTFTADYFPLNFGPGWIGLGWPEILAKWEKEGNYPELKYPVKVGDIFPLNDEYMYLFKKYHPIIVQSIAEELQC